MINCDGQWLAYLLLGSCFPNNQEEMGAQKQPCWLQILMDVGRGPGVGWPFHKLPIPGGCWKLPCKTALLFSSHGEGLLFFLGMWWWTLALRPSSGVKALQIRKTEVSQFFLSLLLWHLLLRLPSLRLLAWLRGAGAKAQWPALLGTYWVRDLATSSCAW